MRTRSVWRLHVGLAVVLAVACDSEDEKLFGEVVEQQTLEVGGVETTATLGRGRQKVELMVPAAALPVRTQVRVSVVSGTVQRGRFPASGTGVLLEPQGLRFERLVRVRQLVPPAPAGRRYRTVVVPDNGTAFIARGPARLVQSASDATEGYEQWEGDSEGSGLWGLALDEPDEAPARPDGGTGDAMSMPMPKPDPDRPATQDAGVADAGLPVDAPIATGSGGGGGRNVDPMPMGGSPGTKDAGASGSGGNTGGGGSSGSGGNTSGGGGNSGGGSGGQGGGISTGGTSGSGGSTGPDAGFGGTAGHGGDMDAGVGGSGGSGAATGSGGFGGFTLAPDPGSPGSGGSGGFFLIGAGGSGI